MEKTTEAQQQITGSPMIEPQVDQGVEMPEYTEELEEEGATSGL